MTRSYAVPRQCIKIDPTDLGASVLVPCARHSHSIPVSPAHAETNPKQPVGTEVMEKTTLKSTAWGKRRSDDGNVETARLGLAEHSMDVAAVFESIANLPSIRRTMTELAECEITRESVARLCVLAFLHDIGKANAGFQSKALPDNTRHDWLARNGIRPDQCGHTHAVAGLLCNQGKQAALAQCFPLEHILGWGAATADLWTASISHHGTPINADTLNASIHRWQTQSWEPAYNYDPMKEVTRLGEWVRKWFPMAWGDGADLPVTPAFTHYFAGLVSLADWIASNDQESFFPYDGHADTPRPMFSRTRAREVIRRMHLDVEAARADLAQRSPAFQEAFQSPDGAPFNPTALQRKMENPGLGQIVIAESETGSGKTEAALWRYKSLFEAGKVDGLAFLLPTRVAAVAIERRVERFISNLFPDPSLRPNVVLAVPGYIRADGEEGHLLARFETQWPDSDDETAAHRRWAAEHPKRYLAAAVSVGTIDQALLSALRVRHAHLRGAALLRTLIVVDEVHSSDRYMTHLLRHLLRRHKDAGGHALLLSATLGSETRDQLTSTGQARLRANQKRKSDNPRGVDIPYPAVTDETATYPIAATETTKTIRIALRPDIDDAREIAVKAASAAHQGARVLVVRNTVKGAIAIQRALEQLDEDHHEGLFKARGLAAPHHGRFAAEDRRILDEAVENTFGKEAERHRGVVLAGTQTLEQSLDIDADLLITDLAPADVLLQRLGRLHRHKRDDRPHGFTSPTAIVLTPSSDNLEFCLTRRAGNAKHGIGNVYENVLSVESTWKLLKRQTHLSIPADNRRLVETTTNKDRLAELAGEMNDIWTKHWNDYIGQEYAKGGAAQAVLLSWSEPWNEQSGREEQTRRAKTRIGADDRLAEFTAPWTSPFLQTIKRLKIPGWMVEEDTAADEPATIIDKMNDGTTRFKWAQLTFVYSRHGLELDSATTSNRQGIRE